MSQYAFRPTRRVALHLRLSKQDEAEHSIENQRDRLTDWAWEEGWEIIAEYLDDDASAFRKVQARRQFVQMIEDAEAGQFDAILVLKLDRWMRGMGNSAIYRARIFSAGVRLRSFHEREAWNGTLGGFVQGGMGDFMAEYYSVDLSIKTAEGWKKRAEKGLTLGDVPFGYTRDHAQQPIEPVEPEAAAVVRLHERYATGCHSMAVLADELNERGFAPRSKRCKRRFSKAGVERILKNPVYAGWVTRHGAKVRRGLHQPIVPDELFDRVQEVIAVRARRPRALPRQPAFPYMLSGIGVCATCLGPLWGNTVRRRDKHYYRCAARRRGESCPDHSVGARAEPIEESLGWMFERLHLPADWQARVRELSESEEDGETLEARRLHWEDQRRRAARGFQLGLLEEAVAVAMKAEADAALRDLEPVSLETTVAAGELLTDMADAWEHLTPLERREAAQITLSRVAVDTRSDQVAGFEAKRDFAPLFETVAATGGSVAVCAWRPRAGSG